MKFKITVAVLGTATFLQLMIGTVTFAEPKADLAQQATNRSLAAAIDKLKSVQTSLDVTPDNTQAAATPQAPQAAAPVKPQNQAETPVPAARPDSEDVITLDLTGKDKGADSKQVMKRDAALKKRAVKLKKQRSTAPAREDDGKSSQQKPSMMAKLSRSEALDRRRASLADAALGFRGTPYVWGGDSPRAFDCSGFTQYLYKKHFGIKLPHNARMQFGKGRPVGRGELAVGDLVFFNTRGPLSHVGMFIGDGKFIHAANPRRGVRVDALSGYYGKTYAGARRYR